ncbi:MAG: hypothetical protein ACXAEB_09770 [Candidatus Thorarchaeota archaeon]|jgi:NAD+ kinase
MEATSTKIGLLSGLEVGMIQDAKQVIGILESNGVSIELEEKLAKALGASGKPLRRMESDVIAIVGSDGVLLKSLLSMTTIPVPILPIASRGQPDFLFDVPAMGFESVVTDLIDGRWSEERRMRLVANITGKDGPPLLNDIGIFARRSATLLRYSLFLDGESFWKDGSDGLIISTPTGSTAYSMSVGGPVILNPSKVISIIPVNSINPARRPLVVPDEMQIEIRDLTSSVTIEAVIDGQIRRKVDGSPILIKRSDQDAIFVKFSEERVDALRGKLLKKTETIDDLAQDLPPSAKLVLKVLEYKGQLTQKGIIEETMLPSRTVRYALSLLISEGLVSKHLSLRDSRQGLYEVTNNRTSSSKKRVQ